MNLIEKLKNKDNFTAAETSLAEYILNNIENLPAVLSTDVIASDTHKSQSL